MKEAVQDLSALVNRLYALQALPVVSIVTDNEDDARYYRDFGRVPVLQEDETLECPVFGNWGEWYAFWGWVAYRDITHDDTFRVMTDDVVKHTDWSFETSCMIDLIHALVVVREDYDEKFGHYPVDTERFLRDCFELGGDFVLDADEH